MSMQLRRYPLWVNGQPVHLSDDSPHLMVRRPDSGEVVARVSSATLPLLMDSIATAYSLRKTLRATSAYSRAEVLLEISRQIAGAFAEELENRIIEEAGKPRALARAEVQRAAVTFRLASEEARRWGMESMPLEGEQAAVGFSNAECFKVPRGVVFAITPFNFPLNLAAHKVAPALAVGAPVLLKPPHQAPGACDTLLQIWDSVVKKWNQSRPLDSIPHASLQLIHAEPSLLEEVAKDSRVSVVSFTGSDRVGWKLKGLLPKKQVLLELGGNASVVVHQDADLSRAVARCIYGAFAYSGQICISVQNIWVHSSRFEEFKKLLIASFAQIPVGEPGDASVLMGPIIDSQSRKRIVEWRQEAVSKGAKVLVEGHLPAGLEHPESYLPPFVLEGVSEHTQFSKDELFGPGVALYSYDTLDGLIDKLNQSRFGLQGGVFTYSPQVVKRLVDEWEVGGVIVNEVPTWRVDSLPYGGTKDSGVGREGPRFAMEDYCELRVKVEKLA